MSRQCRAEAVAICAQAYHRWPLEPAPAERTSHPFPSLSSRFTAWAQVSFIPSASVTVKFEATRSTYACPRASRNSRSWVLLPYTSSPQMKSKLIPPAYASAQISIASCPLVRNSRSAGSPVTSDRTGSLTCSRGIHCRAPISACPVFSRTYARCTTLIPFATRPAHPRYCLLTPAVAVPCFSCPVSSSAPAVIPPALRFRRAAPSSPATANRRTALIAAISSQDAWFSSRCVLSGVWSPACRAMLHPFTRGSPPASAATYLPACSHTSVRAKHGRSDSSRPARSRSAVPVPDRKLPHLEGGNQPLSAA